MATDPTQPTVFPVLRYQDATGAIHFLEDAFGLVAAVVHHDDGGRVEHAVLGWSNGAVMLAESRAEGSPYELGPICLYLVVDDPDAHHARAAAAGAEIVEAPVDRSYGSREYAARDREGNVWCFGTYQPALVPSPR
jgi:uncharacterized glyoxalase superfamily protein PhnB